ncbi:MAG: riboflavin synthase [Woeseiaceae bacterium]|nr:riboflavin synthase [Woeseiaceae bacterium]
MFTGIIKAVGEVGQIARQGGDLRLTIQSPDLPWAEFDVGESISVNGVCLTAVAFVSGGFLTDVSAETLAVTTLQQVSAGSRVNLEPALALGERLGGHLVSGHVDCIGTIKAREVDARSVRIDVEVPAEYGRYIAKKGSVCIDGVSLTVNTVAANTFSVNIIPHTAEVTTVKTYEVGGLVNIEVDLLARYLERLLTADDGNGITQDFLRANGYV